MVVPCHGRRVMAVGLFSVVNACGLIAGAPDLYLAEQQDAGSDVSSGGRDAASDTLPDAQPRCASDDDCPQPLGPCLHVRCLTATGRCSGAEPHAFEVAQFTIAPGTCAGLNPNQCLVIVPPYLVVPTASGLALYDVRAPAASSHASTSAAAPFGSANLAVGGRRLWLVSPRGDGASVAWVDVPTTTNAKPLVFGSGVINEPGLGRRQVDATFATPDGTRVVVPMTKNPVAVAFVVSPTAGGGITTTLAPLSSCCELDDIDVLSGARVFNWDVVYGSRAYFSFFEGPNAGSIAQKTDLPIGRPEYSRSHVASRDESGATFLSGIDCSPGGACVARLRWTVDGATAADTSTANAADQAWYPGGIDCGPTPCMFAAVADAGHVVLVAPAGAGDPVYDAATRASASLPAWVRTLERIGQVTKVVVNRAATLPLPANAYRLASYPGTSYVFALEEKNASDRRVRVFDYGCDKR